jgi:Ca2+-binding RTX toxin-like protein
MSDTRVNTYTAGNQSSPVMAVGSSGGSVILWVDGDRQGIYAQRLNTAGLAIGGETFVTAGLSPHNPQVAMDASDNFVVVWQDQVRDETGIPWGHVYAQRFDAAGLALGSAIQVDTPLLAYSNAQAPDVSMDDNGDFVVTWVTRSSDDFWTGIYAQRFNATGIAEGSNFRVSSNRVWADTGPAVAMDSDGDFVVTWTSDGGMPGEVGDGSQNGVFAQRFSAAGIALDDEFRVNTFTDFFQGIPDVAMADDGGFVVTWISNGQDGSGVGIYAQRYSATGAPIGNEFQVNTTTVGPQDNPAVAMDAAGNFVIAWDSPDGSGDGVYAQRYNVAGAALGGEIQVNTFTSSGQQAPAVVMAANGDVTVVWESLGQDGSGSGVYLNFLGDGGDNTLTSGPGADLLAGGFGDDWASYASATVAVTVDLGTGSSSGGHGIDQLIGIEAVLGGSGADSLLGDAGSNTLNGGAGADTMAGGAGNDIFFVLDAADLVIEGAGGGADTIITSVSMTAPDHVEALQIASGISGITLTGGAGNDMLMGNGLANTFVGGAGDDVILVGTVTLADIYALFAT